MLRLWRTEWGRSVSDERATIFWPHLLPFAGRVREALHTRFQSFKSWQGDHVLRLPSLLREQLSLGQSYVLRKTVILAAEGRSGTTLVSAALFDALDSFLYLYEPCRRRPASLKHSIDVGWTKSNATLHGRACASYVTRLLSCSVDYADFERLYADQPALSQSRYMQQLLQQIPNPRDAYRPWVLQCLTRHTVAKVLRIGDFSEMDRFWELLPRLRVIHLVRDPLHVVQSWLKLADFRSGGGEWVDNSHGDGVEAVAWSVCSRMAAKLPSSIQGRDPWRGGARYHYRLARYEDFVAKPVETTTQIFEWLGFSSHVPISTRSFLARCGLGSGSALLGSDGAEDANNHVLDVARLAVHERNLSYANASGENKRQYDGCSGGSSNKADPAASPFVTLPVVASEPSCQVVAKRYGYLMATNGYLLPRSDSHEQTSKGVVAHAPQPVGAFGACELAPELADGNRLIEWELVRGGGGSAAERPPVDADPLAPDLFQTVRNTYIFDRCFVPRMICELIIGSGRPLQIPRTIPVSAQRGALPPGSYVVALGPGATVGAASRTNWVDELELALNRPVVNLGRGGAAPSLYVHASWPLLSKLVSGAALVVCVIMSGRSSPNSQFPLNATLHERERGLQCPLTRDVSTVEDRQRACANAERLAQESLASAMHDYLQLVRRIRNDGQQMHGRTPSIYFLWMSKRGVSERSSQSNILGSHTSHEFPHFISSQFLQQLTAATDVPVIDASYGVLTNGGEGTPIPLDQCDHCPVPRREGGGEHIEVCNINQARADACGDASVRSTRVLLDRTLDTPYCFAKQSGMAKPWPVLPAASAAARTVNLCATRCATVKNGYYPPAAAHKLAVQRLIDAIAADRSIRWATPAPAP